MEQLAPATVVDRYVVERSLGTGGMATVYLVRHQRLGTAHALKLLHLPTASIRDRLMQEGRIQGGLHHPNVVNVTDVVDWRGAPGLIMEFVDGPALDGFLSATQLTVEQADSLARGLITGVGAAHRQGLVHRDLKPGNILLRQMEGEIVPKITDFGLVKLHDGSAPSGGQKTRSGVAMGTPSYMAPEQIRDASSVDLRADIFSLGAILYELVTGRRAFYGDDMLEIFDRVRDADYRPVHELVKDLPDRMKAAIDGALQVDLDERIPDCQTLLQIWTDGDATPLRSGIWDQTTREHVRALSPTSMPPPDPSTGVGASSETFDYSAPPSTLGDQTPLDPETTQPQVPLPEPAHRSRALWLISAGVLLAGLAGAVAWWDYDRVKVTYYAYAETQLSAVELWRELDAEEIQQFPTHYRVETRRGRALSVQQQNQRGKPAIGDVYDRIIQWEAAVADGGSLHFRYDDDGRLVGVDIHSQLGDKEGSHEVEWVATDRARFRTMDAHGRLRATNGGSYTQEWSLDELGHVVEGRSLDASGENPVASILDGSSGTRVKTDELGRELRMETLDHAGAAMRDRDGAMARTQTFEDPDHPWLPTTIRAEGFGGVPAMALDGCAELHFEYQDGSMVKQSCWDGEGKPALNNGLCHVNLVERTPGRRQITCGGLDGRPTMSAMGVAQLVTLYDDNGYPQEYRGLDVEGKSANLRTGHARWQTTYDEWGVQLQVGPRFNAAGEPAIDALTRTAITRGTYDDGRLVEVTFHDADGRLTMSRFGFAIRRFEYDGTAQLTGWRLFDEKGEPTTSVWGYHRLVREEENGLVTATRIFAIDAQPTIGRWSPSWPFKSPDLGSQLMAGVHGIHAEYDEAGRETKTFFTGADGEPIVNRELGYGSQSRTYDDRGNLTEQTYFGVDDKPMLGPQQFATLKLRYNDRGLLTESLMFGVDGAPTPGIGGYHRMKATLNSDGLTTEQRYFDAAGMPVARLDEGCAKISHGWQRRDLAWSKCFGPDGEPAALLPHGVFHVAWKHDILGRETELKTYDGNGKPTLHSGGFYARQQDFDENGNVLETRFYDAEQQPMVAGEGYARLTQEYDRSGNLVAEATFAPDGEPIVPRTRPGFRTERAHDSLGRVTLERVLDVDGSPISGLAQTTYKYDSMGNEVERRFALGDGTPADKRLGYSRIGLTYDEFGQTIRMAWFSADDQPAASEQGCRVLTATYDELGVQTDTNCQK